MIRVQFEGSLPEDELRRFDGVMNYSVSDGLCEIIVDDAERRAGPLAALFSSGGARIKKMTLEQTDLEDVFIEFTKKGDPDQSLCL